MHSPRPVRQRLMSIMLLTSAAAIALMTIGFGSYEYIAARNRLMENVSTLAQIIAANSTAALAFRDERGAYDVLASLRSEPSITAAVLYDQDGTIFVRYSADETKHRAPARAGPDGFAFASGYSKGSSRCESSRTSASARCTCERTSVSCINVSGCTGSSRRSS